jgi:tRNA (guanine26-N2/guanine27-N2)-dimethyltransferase
MERVREGGLEISVPQQPAAGAGEAVFYNPDMTLNRDVTVAALRAFRERTPDAETYLDANAATGIRAVRAAADGWTVTAMDVDHEAVALTRANLRENGFNATVRVRDATSELHRQHYDVVDIDPFGTPVPFTDAAVRGTGRLLCVTATDTAPLCGAHFDAGVRRYDAVPRNTEYHREMGLRVLLSSLVRTAARHDIGLEPVLSHATRHYVRTYLRIERGASPAKAALDELGFLHHCEACLLRESEVGRLPDAPSDCPACGSNRVVTAGPLWLGGVHDVAFVSATRQQLTPELDERPKADRLLRRLGNELDIPHHFDQHRLCKLWNRPAGPMDEFLSALESAGYRASRSHYGGTTFKTDADVAAIQEATA